MPHIRLLRSSPMPDEAGEKMEGVGGYVVGGMCVGVCVWRGTCVHRVYVWMRVGGMGYVVGRSV